MSKVVLLTGATDGIGRQTALELARSGMRVIVHGRSADKVQAVQAAIRALGAPEPEGVVADLGALQAVRALAAQIRERHPRLDALVNNAGVYAESRQLTGDGFELAFAVNHLAPFLLTNLLREPLAAARGRVVTVSSIAHTRGALDFDDLQMARGFTGYAAYATSKLANVLFSNALARRVQGDGVTSNSLHPGVIGTKLLRAGFGMDGGSVEEGAATSVHLATAPELEGVTGRYFSDRREVLPSPAARDEALQERLWQVSEELVGL